MITFEQTLNDLHKSVYSVDDGGGKGIVTVNKATKKAKYVGDHLVWFPPAWIENLAIGLVEHPGAPKKFAYGFG